MGNKERLMVDETKFTKLTPEEYNKLSTDEKIDYHVKNGKTNVKHIKPNVKGSEASHNFHKKGMKTRMENKMKREALKHAVAAFGSNKLDSNEDLTSLETLKIIRNLYIAQEDWDKVVDISKSLAEYEASKKTRVEEIKSEIDFNDYSAEDVQDYLSDVISLEELRAKRA